jgi:hypothetical protein
LLLGVIVCAFFHRTFIGERFFALDFYQTFVPLRSILAEAWTHGFPLWTDRLGNGSPVFLNPAYGTLYPPNLLYLGTDPARSMTVLTVAHYVFGALGVWWLARRWELSRAASWTASVGFALSGALVSSTAYPNLAWPAAWMPWALLAQEAATAGGSRWAVAALSFIWFSMVSMGDPIVFAATVAGQAALHARTLATRSAEGFRGRTVRALLPLGAAALLAMLLALPLIVAIARYLPASVRGAGFKESGIVQWSLHPALLAELALPEPYGNAIAPGPAGFWAAGLAADRGRPLLPGLYVGGLLLALSCLGAVRRTAERTSLLVWLALLVALALGKFGPIYPIVGDSEWFDSLRYPAKWIVPAMLPLALLAGSGVDFDRRAARARPLISNRGVRVPRSPRGARGGLDRRDERTRSCARLAIGKAGRRFGRARGPHSRRLGFGCDVVGRSARRRTRRSRAGSARAKRGHRARGDRGTRDA